MDVTIDINKIIARVRESFAAPTKLLKSAKSEKGWQEALVYLAILSLVGTILTVFYTLVLFPILQPVLKSSFGVAAQNYTLDQIIPAAAISLVITLAISFVYAFFFKIWVNFFGAESKYNQAYRLLVYARTPSYILSWLPVVNAFATIYSLVLIFKGLKVFYGFTSKRATTALLLGVLILLVINFAMFALLVNYS